MVMGLYPLSGNILPTNTPRALRNIRLYLLRVFESYLVIAVRADRLANKRAGFFSRRYLFVRYILKYFPRHFLVTIVIMHPSDKRAEPMGTVDDEYVLTCAPQDNSRYQITASKRTALCDPESNPTPCPNQKMPRAI